MPCPHGFHGCRSPSIQQHACHADQIVIVTRKQTIGSIAACLCMATSDCGAFRRFGDLATIQQCVSWPSSDACVGDHLRLIGPGGVRAVVAESVLVKQQLLILNRARKRSPRLRLTDRVITGVCALFIPPGHLAGRPVLFARRSDRPERSAGRRHPNEYVCAA